MTRFIREFEPDMMTAMVTGAAGVLGRATVTMLLQDGYEPPPYFLQSAPAAWLFVSSP
jgi:hypothetical protein